MFIARTMMPKRLSQSSSPRTRLVSVTAQAISKPLDKRQTAVLRRIAKRQHAEDDSHIEFPGIPELTAEQLREARPRTSR
jgi:hypothetical protein